MLLSTDLRHSAFYPFPSTACWLPFPWQVPFPWAGGAPGQVHWPTLPRDGSESS